MKRDMGVFLRIGMCLVLAVVFAGCAHQKAYKKADQYVQKQNYDQAVRSLQEAINLVDKPKTVEKYETRLREVKKEAAQYYYGRAEDDFAGADLTSALQSIGHAVRYQPALSSSLALQKRIQSAIQLAELHHGQAMALADKEQWREAVTALQRVSREYRSMPGLKADLEQVSQRAYMHYLGQATRHLGEEDLDEAAEKANLALTFVDDGREAQDLIRTVEDRREAQRLIALARRQLAAKSPEEALDLLNRASRLHASANDLVELTLQAKKGVCDLLIAQAEVYLEQESRVAALPLLLRSQDLLPGHGQVPQKIAAVRTELSEQHLAQAALYQKQSLHGAALYHAVAALDYSEEGPEAREQQRVSMQAVQKAIQYSVAYGGFGALQEQAFAVARLNPMTLVLLNRLRPACVRILEEPRADADAVLKGEILTLDLLEDTQVKAHGRSEYQDGMRPEPNPDYVAAKEEADLALVDLNSAREQLALAKKRRAQVANPDPNDAEAVRRSRRAEGDLVEAQEHTVTAATNLAIASTKASATPQEILVPNIVEYEYPIHTVKKSARLACLIKMTDKQTGAMLLADQIEAQWSQSDTVIQGVPERNVPDDPLELEDDLVFYEHAIKALERHLGDMLQVGLSKHSERFVTAFQQAEASSDQGLAVDQCLKYLFAHPVGAEHENTMIEYLHSYLGKEDTLLDMASLLKKHCRILLRYAEFPAQLEEQDNTVVIRRFTDPGASPVRCPCTLVSIDGQAVHSIAQVRSLIGRHDEDDKVTLSVLSEGRSITRQLALKPE
ncbi:MAG: hypothetical protein GY809_24735 [Planctomycetes bacterium]|nr:hypothetical protein [Planctomycetota bacterium]